MRLWPCAGIGRQTRLKICCTLLCVWVQVPPRPPKLCTCHPSHPCDAHINSHLATVLDVCLYARIQVPPRPPPFASATLRVAAPPEMRSSTTRRSATRSFSGGWPFKSRYGPEYRPTKTNINRLPRGVFFLAFYVFNKMIKTS